jgi:hypothetical protein
MQIANPIYDTFFKYLLEDTKLATKLLSAVLEEEIISLELRPQELLVPLPEKFLSIMRVDFKAIIRTPDGKTKKILIEMQKCRVMFDIMRFRRYLANNYGREDEIITQNGNITEVLPIITIYFLNFKLKNVKFPILKIDRNYTNLVSKEITHVKDDFIEQLTHDCYTIQIPRLELNMQNKLEKLLSIFNQKYVTSKDSKIMNLPPEWNEDAELKEFIEKMNKPLQDETMINKAEVEDEIERIFLDSERKLLDAEKTINESKQEIARMKEETEKLQEQMEREKIALQKQAENEKQNTIENLLSLGLTAEQIAKSLQISVEKVIEIKTKLGL